MAAPTEIGAYRNAIATLVKDPTNLAIALPYGGTELGPIRGHRYLPMERVARVRDEAKGARPYAGIRSGRWAIFTCILRGWDPVAISLLFPDSPGNGDVKASDAGSPTSPPGSLAGTCKILAVPVTAGHPALYFPNAMPTIAREQEVPFENKLEVALVLSFDALPDASGNVYYIQPISRLTL
jgi:hypothetical protein